MGADWVCLFDKRLCDEILDLTPTNFAGFVESHRSALHWSSELAFESEGDVPAGLRLQELRAQGRSEEELKADLVEHLCVSKERLTIDYWGCYVETFRGADPPGAIPDHDLFPHIKQQGYLLLRSEHVDTMISSLERHKSDIRIMTQAQVDQLREWGQRCRKNPDYLVAYFYDA